MTALFVLRRELRALLRLPQTYAIAATYVVISGIFFVNILVSTEVADLAAYYSNVTNTLLVLAPVVAMRSFAEERRSGALDVSLSWPVSRTGLVLGKFAANTLLTWALASLVWVYYSLVATLANIQASRTVGGYLGLLLMAMAFSALAIMVSARAASTTAAAFLGFGLLLFLWILDYAPGWIGDTLRSLGPAAHFESFPRGVIYWEDAAYFLATTTVGLVLAVAALNRERPGRAGQSLGRRSVVLALVLIVWSGGSAVASSVGGSFDLTAAKQNTLSDVTRKVLRSAPAPIRLTTFARPFSSEEAQFQTLVKEYRAAGAQLAAEQFDPDVQPAKARRAGITVYGQILVEVGDRHEVIDGPSEVALTSAIHRLSSAASPRACFTIGHGERSLTDETRDGLSTFVRELQSRHFFEVKPVALGVPGGPDELARCTVVLLAGPQVPLLAAELDLLNRYARADGRLLIMAGTSTAPADQLNGFLAPWGVGFGRGVVSDLSALSGDPASIVSASYPSHSPPTLHLRDAEIPVVMINSVRVEATPMADEGGHFSPLVRSSSKSWIEPPETAAGSGKPPFTLSAVVDHSRLVGTTEGGSIARTRIGVIGSVDAVANRGIELLGNGEFATALVQWVAREEDLISASRGSNGVYKLVLTADQKNRLIRQGIVLPAVLVLLPLPLTLLRLKRG